MADKPALIIRLLANHNLGHNFLYLFKIFSMTNKQMSKKIKDMKIYKGFK
jgi:hypothetical protein